MRVSKGIYALRALMGDHPYEAIGRPKKKNRKSRAGEGWFQVFCMHPPLAFASSIALAL